MKEKDIKIKRKSTAIESPYVFNWPNKKEEKVEKLQEVQVDKEKRISPALLFREKVNQTNNWKISFLHNEKVSLKTIHVVIFAILTLILVLPFQVNALLQQASSEKEYIVSNMLEAAEYWKSGYEALQTNDLEAAEYSFASAKGLFIESGIFPKLKHPFLISILELSPIKPKQYIAFKNGVTSGFLISEAGERIVANVRSIQSEDEVNRVEALVNLEASIHKATENIIEAHFLISQIELSALPISMQGDFNELRSTFNTVVVTAKKIDTIATLLASMAGFDDPKLWMFVFQNSAELRASGGFMGSFGIAKADEGNLEIIDFPGGGTYDLRGSFRKNIISPEPLHLINPIWEFQDSNWWPDWPASARKIIWFYEQGNGATVDGVLSFTPSFLERVLDITGPIMLAEYDFVIDKYNAYEFLQTLSERKQDITNEPKKIIADLAKVILEESETLFKPEDTIKILSLLVESIEQRQLLVYWNEEEGQKILSDNNWDGSLVDSQTDDYFMVVHTNIAGGKSDRSIKDVVIIDSKILENGRIKNRATLTRTHHGKEGTGFSGVRNVDYVRFYVPKGSELLSSSGFNKPDESLFETPPEGFVEDTDYLAYETNKRYDEVSKTESFLSFGKTVFANWLMVDPGESKSVTIEYLLPQTVAVMPEEYTFYIQKQSGWQGAQLQYSLSWPKSWNPALVNGSSPGDASTVRYAANIAKDIQLKTEWKPNNYAKK